MKLSEMVSTPEPLPQPGPTPLQASVKEFGGNCIALFDPVTRMMSFVPCQQPRRAAHGMGGVREDATL